MMNIRKPLVEVKDNLITYIAEGYGILGNALQAPQDVSGVPQRFQDWDNAVTNYLAETFPTRKEAGQFSYSFGSEHTYPNMHRQLHRVVDEVNHKVQVLETILDSLDRYYQFEPDKKQLFIQAIDSFGRVRGINYKQVQQFLRDGALDKPEQEIKEAFAAIIGQSYVQKDWGGETEDIFTSRILLNGERVQASIMFKGPGTIKGRETHLGDLGTGTNQLERMFRTPSSKLFIIQSVKPVGQDIVNTAQALVNQQWAQGNRCYFCVVDGQDTAMILYAYGYLPQPNAGSG